MAHLKVGLFGGSFNPIHFGHFHLAYTLKESAQLDEIWWIPCHTPPLPKSAPLLPFHLRADLVELALASTSNMLCLRTEGKRTGPSYTIDTVKECKTLHPSTSFHLLLGEDLLSTLHLWKEVEALFELAPPLIAKRSQTPLPSLPHLSTPLQNVIKKNLYIEPLIEISSSLIRERLSKKLPCHHLLPQPVLDYIQQNHLYSQAV